MFTGKVTVTVKPGPKFDFVVEGVNDDQIPLFVQGVAEALQKAATSTTWGPIRFEEPCVVDGCTNTIDDPAKVGMCPECWTSTFPDTGPLSL